LAGTNNMKKQIRLNLGSGITISRGFINVDKMYTEKDLKSKKGNFINANFAKGAKYIQADMLALPFKDNYADYIETVDAIEHISFRFVSIALKEMYRVLKPKGKLVIVTTNFDQLARLWTETIAGKPIETQEAFENYKNVMEVIYGNQANGGEFHCTPFNPQFLAILLDQAGFDIKKKMKMTIYPMGNLKVGEKIKTLKIDKGHGARTEMIVVEVIK